MTEASLNEITQECPTSARLWPENLEQASTVAASHMARYTFAQKYADGKKVCDIACGVGYGSNFLAQAPQKVTGIDISETALKNMVQKYFPKAEYFSQACKKEIKHYGAKALRKLKLLKKQPYFTSNYFLLPVLSSMKTMGKQAGLEIVKRHPGKNLIEQQCLILFKKTQDL
jgi:SAM-dependent methyltransferase